MAKRTPIRLDAISSERPDAEPRVSSDQPLSSAREPTTVIYARVPWSLGEKLRDLARARSRTEQRRVTVNELVSEAISKLAS